MSAFTLIFADRKLSATRHETVEKLLHGKVFEYDHDKFHNKPIRQIIAELNAECDNKLHGIYFDMTNVQCVTFINQHLHVVMNEFNRLVLTTSGTDTFIENLRAHLVMKWRTIPLVDVIVRGEKHGIVSVSHIVRARTWYARVWYHIKKYIPFVRRSVLKMAEDVMKGEVEK